MRLIEIWPAIVFGWPAIFVALALAVTGILRGNFIWLLVAAILVVPISFYLAGSPRFGWFGLSIPLFVSGAGLAVHYHRKNVAWMLLFPVVAIFAWLAIAVLGE